MHSTLLFFKHKKKYLKKIPLTLAGKKNILYLCHGNQEGLVA